MNADQDVAVRGNAVEEAEIVRTVLDYFEGWFDGDVERVSRAMHPQLAKRSLAIDQGGAEVLRSTTAQPMIDATAQGVGGSRDVSDRRINVDVVDVYGEIASVVVRSAVYREYLHMARTKSGWKIINALWRRT